MAVSFHAPHTLGKWLVSPIRAPALPKRALPGYQVDLTNIHWMSGIDNLLRLYLGRLLMVVVNWEVFDACRASSRYD